MKSENKIKAEAIFNFVDLMIGAFESGFVDKNNPTLSEIHQVARNHVFDTYGKEYPPIDQRWSKELAKECGLGQP
jgi:hypothetical protein